MIFCVTSDCELARELYQKNHGLLRSAKSMATLHASAKRAVRLSEAKGKGKRKQDDMDVDEFVDEEIQQPKKKRNKQRVLMLSSRGVTHRMRHLMNDLEALLPHIKKGGCS